MFFNIIYQTKKSAQKKICTTCFLCTIRLEMKNNFEVETPPHMQVKFQNLV